MGYLFRIILEYKNGFLTKKIRFFDKNFERLQKVLEVMKMCNEFESYYSKCD